MVDLDLGIEKVMGNWKDVGSVSKMTLLVCLMSFGCGL
jgi:hypothetical protein